MIDVMWSEFFIIAVIALIFLGPSDFLVMIKTMGRWVSKLQSMAHSIKMDIDFESYKQEKEKDQDLPPMIEIKNNENLDK